MTTRVQAAEILLVEDDPNDVTLIQRALTKANVTNRIVVTRDGAEALDYLFARNDYAARAETDQPRMVLLDLKLPKVDGLEVLHQMKEHDVTRKTPVVILTSSREAPDIQRAYELGANSYIVKPVEFGDFVRAVTDAGLYWMVLNEPPE